MASDLKFWKYGIPIGSVDSWDYTHNGMDYWKYGIPISRFVSEHISRTTNVGAGVEYSDFSKVRTTNIGTEVEYQYQSLIRTTNIGVGVEYSPLSLITVTLSGAVGISDSLVTVRNLYRSILNSVNVSDTVTNLRELYRVLSDNINVADTINTARSLFRTILDTLNISDAITASGISGQVWQYASPIADLLNSGWTNELGETLNIYTSIDELEYNDLDYIASPDQPVSAEIYRTTLSGLFTPLTKTNHTLFYRYTLSGTGNVDLTVRLLQGESQIAQWTHSGVGNEWVTAEQSLTQGEMDAITNYADLSVVIFANVQ